MKSTIVYLKGFNNYFNRILKRYVSIDSYKNNSDDFIECENYNFIMNDGVNTSTTLNLSVGDYWNPDYAVVIDPTTREILSRWYITNSERTRSFQYKLYLKRDTLADFYSSIKDSPMYVEKGILSSDDPMIYNSELLTCNQIKEDEFFLRDYTRSAWLVCYLDRKVQSETIAIPTANSTADIVLQVPFAEWQYADYVKGALSGTSEIVNGYSSNFNLEIRAVEIDEPVPGRDYPIYRGRRFTYNLTNRSLNLDLGNIDSRYGNVISPYNQSALKATLDSHFSTLELNIKNIIGVNSSLYNTLKSFDKKIIQDSTGKQFAITFRDTTGRAYSLDSLDPATQEQLTLRNSLNLWLGQEAGFGNLPTGSDKAVMYKLNGNLEKGFLEAEELEVQTQDSVIISAQRNHTTDAQYDIICLPYSDKVSLKITDTDTERFISKARAVSIINAISTGLGSQVYDIQLLPFCPIANLDVEHIGSYYNTRIKVLSSDEGKLFSSLGLPGSSSGFVFYAPYSNSTRQILNLPGDYRYSEANESELIKINNDLIKYRFTSPDYSASFDFNIAKNNMLLNSVMVDMSCKPQSSFIHIVPELTGLYGNPNISGNDSPIIDIRGLTFTTNLSIDRISNAFVEYEIRNKNYQEIFNREIQNYDIGSDIRKMEASVSYASKSIQATSKGASQGFALGGGFGAIAGAVVGAGVGLTSGAVDISNTWKMEDENRSLKVDMFNYSLQNIRALPNTLTKISSLTNTNRIFPVIEIYAPTERELKAYVDKIRWDGMSVNRIDKLSNFLQPFSEEVAGAFFKGQLININKIDEDSHIVADIYDQLDSGIYLNVIEEDKTEE